MRLWALLAVGAVAACAPETKSTAEAKPDVASVFAVACSGTSTTIDTSIDLKEVTSLPEQVFVIDESAKRVKRALYPRQMFDDLCLASKSCAVAISTGQISVKSAAPGNNSRSTTELWVDRRSGRATYTMALMFANGGRHETQWEMQCTKAPVPRFAKSEYQF